MGDIKKHIQGLNTEKYDDEILSLDLMSAQEIVEKINEKDKLIAFKIEKLIPEIAKAAQAISESYNEEGRIIYTGAGSSGRLGVMDSVELGPTYNVSSDRAFGLLAGGNSAMFVAVEGAEDDYDQGRKEIVECEVSNKDVVIGIAASGRTPYTLGTLVEAKERGAFTIAITSNPGSEMGKVSDIAIEVESEPEIVAGSTRMGSGTAHKMITNMLSTTAMILSGKVYDQYMVHLRPTNEKLVQRSILLIQQITGVDEKRASELFEMADHVVATALVIELGGIDGPLAKNALNQTGGNVRKALELATK